MDDPLLKHHLPLTSPAVPFRVASNALPYHHRTWAGTFHSLPALYLKPRSIEEIQKIIRLARLCRRRVVVTGSAHSPSNITCTSSWLISLDDFAGVLDVDYGNALEKDKEANALDSEASTPITPASEEAEDEILVTVQAGIRLRALNAHLAARGLALPNLGSIDAQSAAGALATGTHGSSLRHGLLSGRVRALRLVRADGAAVRASEDERPELFRAAIVSLGALGVVAELTLAVARGFNVAWRQEVVPLDEVLVAWERGELWQRAEWVRIWLFPYMRKCVVWAADKTDEPLRGPGSGAVTRFREWFGEKVYYLLLYASLWKPSILPWIERLVISVQFSGSGELSGVASAQEGLLLNCLYSQFVNEWAMPLRQGPDALRKLTSWINHEPAFASGISIPGRGVYVHAPIEVRCSDTSRDYPRPFLDFTCAREPTLFINATLYRPFGRDPPAWRQYYAAFEQLMLSYNGRPHWAKNFVHADVASLYPWDDVSRWSRVRDECDPDGMFAGDWLRQHVLGGVGTRAEGGGAGLLPLEERMVSVNRARGGGLLWEGEVSRRVVSPRDSEESFDMMRRSEANPIG